MKKLLLFLLLLITAALCLWPNLHPENLVVDRYYWFMDLITHGGYYFMATLLLLGLRLKVNTFVLISAFFIFSVVLEVLQMYSFNRSPDGKDIAWNLVGIALATFAWMLLKKASRGWNKSLTAGVARATKLI